MSKVRFLSHRAKNAFYNMTRYVCCSTTTWMLFYINNIFLKSFLKVKHKWFMYVWVSLSWTFFIWLQRQKTIILFPVILGNDKKSSQKEYLDSQSVCTFATQLKLSALSYSSYNFNKIRRRPCTNFSYMRVLPNIRINY